jgi:N-acetylneuraminic acid mutarotase
MSKKEFPTQQVLELACAAQRVNGAYLKEALAVYAEDSVYMYTKQTNKMLMLTTVDPAVWTADPKEAPMPLKVLPEDTVMADEIKTYFKRLLFAAIEGENEFQTNINSFLNSQNIELKNFGYIACLPSVYARDKVQNTVKKAARAVETGHLGAVGSQLKDLDAEILSSVKSKNFDGYNIDAIINNKMASWLNKTNLNPGACVIVKAKIKDHSKHWKHGNDVTRLNYVKAAQ